MSFVIKFYRKAYREYYEAFEWYEERQLGLGDRFENSIIKTVNAIDKNPLIFANKKYDTREGKTEDFPYLIVYKVFPAKNIIYILQYSTPAEILKRSIRNKSIASSIKLHSLFICI